MDFQTTCTTIFDQTFPSNDQLNNVNNFIDCYV